MNGRSPPTGAGIRRHAAPRSRISTGIPACRGRAAIARTCRGRLRSSDRSPPRRRLAAPPTVTRPAATRGGVIHGRSPSTALADSTAHGAPFIWSPAAWARSYCGLVLHQLFFGRLEEMQQAIEELGAALRLVAECGD